MSVTVEFVGGPKDGEVAMLQQNVPEVKLPAFSKPSPLRLVDKAFPVPNRPNWIIYRRRDGRSRLDGVLFYDFSGWR